MAALDFSEAEIGPHALAQLQRRGISEDQVRSVLANPEKITALGSDRVIAQGPITLAGKSGVYLLRVFVDIDTQPPIIVTAYATSKLSKYRGRP